MEEKTFEEAMARLSAVTAAMEEPNTPLEKLASYYKEGKELYRFCSEKLDTVEKELQILELDHECE